MPFNSPNPVQYTTDDHTSLFLALVTRRFSVARSFVGIVARPAQGEFDFLQLKRPLHCRATIRITYNDCVGW